MVEQGQGVGGVGGPRSPKGERCDSGAAYVLAPSLLALFWRVL